MLLDRTEIEWSRQTKRSKIGRSRSASILLNTLVHEYANEKLKGPVFIDGRKDGDELNAKIKRHYARLAEESKELSAIFQRMLSEIENPKDVAS
jgi:hypothetical protein